MKTIKLSLKGTLVGIVIASMISNFIQTGQINSIEQRLDRLEEQAEDRRAQIVPPEDHRGSGR